MRRVVKTVKTPTDSFYHIIKKSVRLRTILDFQKEVKKLHGGFTKQRYVEAFERTWSDNILNHKSDWLKEAADAIIHCMCNDYSKEELLEFGENSAEIFSEKVTKTKSLYVGEVNYTIKQLALFTLLANTVSDSLCAYYSCWGARELSPSHSLLEELTYLDSPYDFENLPFLSWVSLKGFGLKSSGYEYIKNFNDSELINAQDDIEGVMVINFNEVYQRASREIHPVNVWDEVAYVMGYPDEIKKDALRDHVVFALFTTNKTYPEVRVHNGILISPFDEVEQKLSLLSEGLGESLNGLFMPGCGRRVGLNECVSSGQDFSDYGLAFELALKTIKYSQDSEKVSVSESFTRPCSDIHAKKVKKRNGKKKVTKLTNQYFQIEYLKMPSAENLPQWFKKDPKPSTPRAKSIDPRFMSSHYRRVWVTDSYIEKKGIPEEQVLAVDENRPRHNKFGELIYKKRSLVAIKIDTGHEPLATVTRMS